MPRINGNNSSNEGGNNGKSRSVSGGMKGIKLARRLPHKNKAFDSTLSNRPAFFGGSKSGTSITSTGSQTYTVPKGVDTLTITMYGGGGGGSRATSGRGGTTNGGGGGGGSRLVINLTEVTPGSVLTFSVGAGGAAASSSGTPGANGANTTFSYNGVDYVAGGGEGHKEAGGAGTRDGTGGVADCDSASNCTGTNGNNGGQLGVSVVGGAALGDSAGAGGNGSNNASSQNNTAGGNGKVIIS